ncbi:MAG: helix-turn-helix domain containing protein [Actinobacteria bacterium]|nr:helix-turn-helix domain containing protein [Actinomycetota bacterium]
MEGEKKDTAKRRVLSQNNTLNKNADKVVDPKFKNAAFFDPDDLLQVKYEMLRSVQKDGAGIMKASKSFGFSRITFYKAGKAFNENGLAGLIPKKKGPRRAHKLNKEVMEFVSLLMEQKPGIKPDGIRDKIKERFNLTVHKRSIERAIDRSKKKHPKT